MEQPILYLTVGLTGAGKTYTSQRFAKDSDAIYLNGDALRMAMIEEPTFTADEHRMVYRAMDYIVGQLLQQGRSVIYNANFNRYQTRVEKYTLAKDCHARCIVFWVQVPFEVAKERVLMRQHEIPADKQRRDPLANLRALQATFEPPHSHEPVITVDGTKPYAEQLVDIKSQLARFSPELDHATVKS